MLSAAVRVGYCATATFVAAPLVPLSVMMCDSDPPNAESIILSVSSIPVTLMAAGLMGGHSLWALPLTHFLWLKWSFRDYGSPNPASPTYSKPEPTPDKVQQQQEDDWEFVE